MGFLVLRRARQGCGAGKLAAAFIMADLTGISYGSIAPAVERSALICFALMSHQATWHGRQIEGKARAALPPEAEARFGWMIFVVPFLFVHPPELVLVGPRAQVAASLAGCLAAPVMAGALVAGLSRSGMIIAGLALCLAGVPVIWSGIGALPAVLAVGAALAMAAAAWRPGGGPQSGELQEDADAGFQH